MNNIVILKEKLKDDIIDYYKSMICIVEMNKTLEVTLPMFLDDCNQMTIYLTRNENQLILSSNIMYELETSLYDKTKTTKNILKDYLINDTKFKTLKKALLDNGVNTHSINLTSIKNISDEKSIYEEVIIYSNLIKSYYNNIYHNLVKILSKSQDKYNIFYKNFKHIVETIKTKNKLKEYQKSKFSTNPIYINNQLILSAGKDLESLTKLYFDLKKIKDNENLEVVKGFIFVEITDNRPHEKLESFYQELINLGFKIKEVTETDDLKEKINSELHKEGSFDSVLENRV